MNRPRVFAPNLLTDSVTLLLLNQRVDCSDPGHGVTVEWLAGLAKRVDKLIVITHEAGVLPEVPNAQIHSIGREQGYSRPRRLLRFYWLLWHVLRSEKIDACFVHMVPLFSVLAAPLLKSRCIPIIQWYTHGATPKMLRVALKSVDKIVTASEASFRLPSDKVIVTGHGIDTRHFRPPILNSRQPRPFTVLSIGRISPVKRYEVLLEAMAQVRRKLPECRLILVGAPRDATGKRYLVHLQNLVRTLELQPCIEFIGGLPRAQILTWYWQGDVFVNLSDTDSLDKAALEAMSCGIPLITSNTALKAILSDRPSELLIPKGNADALAASIHTTSRWPAKRRQRVGADLREIVVRNHDLERLMDRLVNLLQRQDLTAGSARSNSSSSPKSDQP